MYRKFSNKRPGVYSIPIVDGSPLSPQEYMEKVGRSVFGRRGLIGFISADAEDFDRIFLIKGI
jgi:hypothetical protein